MLPSCHSFRRTFGAWRQAAAVRRFSLKHARLTAKRDPEDTWTFRLMFGIAVFVMAITVLNEATDIGTDLVPRVFLAWRVLKGDKVFLMNRIPAHCSTKQQTT